MVDDGVKISNATETKCNVTEQTIGLIEATGETGGWCSIIGKPAERGKGLLVFLLLPLLILLIVRKGDILLFLQKK